MSDGRKYGGARIPGSFRGGLMGGTPVRGRGALSPVRILVSQAPTIKMHWIFFLDLYSPDVTAVAPRLEWSRPDNTIRVHLVMTYICCAYNKMNASHA